MWHNVTQGSTNQVWPQFGVTFYPILNLVFRKLKLTILMKVKVLIWYCTQVKIIIIWLPLSHSNLIRYAVLTIQVAWIPDFSSKGWHMGLIKEYKLPYDKTNK